MKISKGNVAIKSNTTNKFQRGVKTNDTISSRGEAVEHITSAIHILGINAKSDIIAKEAIANLSVVLLDLKS